LIKVVAFGLAWWLGLYLLARDATKPALRRAGIGLLGYALALATVDLDVPAVHAVFLALPPVFWTGVLIALLGRPDGIWRWGVVPATVVLAAASPFIGDWAAALVVLPLFWGLALLPRHRSQKQIPQRERHPGDAVTPVVTLPTGTDNLGNRHTEIRGARPVVLLMFGLAVSLVLLSFLTGEARTLLLAGIGCDLLLLGAGVAVLDAFDEGEAIRRDMLWSLLVAGGTAVVFGSQVALAAWLVGRSLEPLAFGVVGAAIAVQVLARPINALADRVAFPAVIQRERTDLRAVAAALPRRAEVPLAEFDETEFARLTRRALSHYGDLGKLASSPLTTLPVISARLSERGVPDAPLARATELKALLLETITHLKPADGDFGTSEEWRHYNALYFYYVVGVRPYSVRTKVTELDPVARRALAWFADHVPERTLHNWQAAAARIVAAELRLTGAWQ
jgi:hypothetical protein